MNTWYYQHEGHEVGPFRVEVLSKLANVGVITNDTPVKNTGEDSWRPLSEILTRQEPSAPISAQEEARYYYLDTSDQPVGPFDLATLQRLHTEKVLSEDTLVSAVGEQEWIPAARLLKLPTARVLMTAPVVSSAGDDVHPRYLPLERYVMLTAVTLGLYPFYLVPLQSRDMKAITGRERMEFTALLILGIVTLSLVTLVMQVLYAHDLERQGKAVNKAGRRESLGTIVLVLTVLGVVLNFAIDNFLVSYVVGISLANGALWLVQQEINLYAASSGTAQAA